jgi:uncharacterized membrane protein YraQ (UPF0718 family)
MDTFINVTVDAARQVIISFQHNWMFLLLSIVMAAFLKLYLDSSKVSSFLSRNKGAGVLAATAAAVGTPLCSCGTMAVILGMMASTMPWAPVIAFMVSSPLTSPGELIYSAGLFGVPFALAFFIASILLGLAGGAAGALLESMGLLKDQARIPGSQREGIIPGDSIQVYSQETCCVSLKKTTSRCDCSSQPTAPDCACGQTAAFEQAIRTDLSVRNAKPKVTLKAFLKEIYSSGIRLLWMFGAFAFVGYLLNGLIPQSWVVAIFGSGHAYSVPLAATFGLPFYINSEASLPLVRSMLDSGMSQGAALAFLIAGSGTSIGAIGGALTIARWRLVATIVAMLWIGAILSGFAYDVLLRMNLF